MPNTLRENYSKALDLYRRNISFFIAIYSNPSRLHKEIFSTNSSFSSLERKFNECFNEAVQLDYKLIAPADRAFPSIQHTLYGNLRHEYQAALTMLATSGSDRNLSHFLARYPHLCEFVVHHAEKINAMSDKWQSRYKNYMNSMECRQYLHSFNYYDPFVVSNKRYFSQIINSMKENVYGLYDTVPLNSTMKNFYATIFRGLRTLNQSLDFKLAPNLFASDVANHILIGNVNFLIDYCSELKELLQNLPDKSLQPTVYQLVFDAVFANAPLDGMLFEDIKQKLTLATASVKEPSSPTGNQTKSEFVHDTDYDPSDHKQQLGSRV